MLALIPGAAAVRVLALGRRPGRGRRPAAVRRSPPPPAPVAGAGDAAAVVPAGAGACSPATSASRTFRAEVAAFGATLADPSCVAVAVDGVAVGGDARRRAADPGQQPEAARRRRRPRGARRRPRVHDRGARGGAGRRRRRRRPLPRRRRRPAADQLDVSGAERPQPGHRPDVARRPRRRRRRRRRAAASTAPSSATAAATTTSSSPRAGSTTCAASRPARTTPCSSTTPASPATRCGRPNPSEAAARELTQLLAARGVDRRRHAERRDGARRRCPSLASVQSAPLSARSSARCWRRATTTPPSCSSRSSAWRRARAGRATPGSAVMASTLPGWGVPMDGRRARRRVGAEQRQPGRRATCSSTCSPGTRPDRSARRRPAGRRRVGHAERRLHRLAGRPGGCRPRPARSATPRTTPTRRR